MQRETSHLSLCVRASLGAMFALVLLTKLLCFGHITPVSAQTHPEQEEELLDDGHSEHGASGYTVRDIASYGQSLDSRGRSIKGSLGTVKLFSPRTLEQLINRDLSSVVVNAFHRAAGILATNAFPEILKATEYDWQLFFERSRKRETGGLSSARCHAAWMGPPANIFISADQLASNCGRLRRSSVEVAEELGSVLVHEIGHAIEFQMMGRGFGRRQRWHSEGFATWFESLSDGETISDTRLEMFQIAVRTLDPEWRPFLFKGSKADYARSYALVAAIAEGHSIPTLLSIYATMDSQNCRFDQAVQQVLGWDMGRWISETLVFLGEGDYGMGSYGQ